MLNELTIKNYALVRSLNLEFGQGLNVMTGETGAGKSVILDSIDFLLGAKASVTAIAFEAQRCEVTGTFAIAKNRFARKFLEELSLFEDEGTLVVRRELDAQGKSKCFINDRPVTVTTLAQLGDYLIDIHGQHDHQLLLKTSAQRDLLDRYGNLEDPANQVAELFAQWKELRAELEKSRISESEKNAKIDLYQFQIKEIENAKLKDGEEEEAEKLLPQLKNAEKLRGLADEAFGQIYESEGSALDRVRKARKALETIENFGIDFKESTEMIEEACIRLEQVADHLERFRMNLVSDPKKLDEIISRQDMIARLKVKHGRTIPEIFAHKESIESELKKLESHEETLKELEQKIVKSHQELLKKAKKLSEQREKAGGELGRLVQKELKDLGFLAGRFSVNLAAEKDAEGRETVTAHGLEKVEFLFSANPGQPLKPLKEVASGGELSRVMLALKKILAESDVVPTLIFDEIDSGVGGTIGHALGEKLKSLSHSHQVLLITHLPQIAAFADQQFLVRKESDKKKTEVAVEPVDRDKRVKEIARMLGGVTGQGREPTPVSVKHAAELIERAR